MGKKYWKSPGEHKGSREIDYLDDYKYLNDEGLLGVVRDDGNRLSSGRRDFLKFCGYSLAGSALIAGCERPIQKAIPYLFQPEEVTPGEANYYATTFFDGDDYGSVLVKVRDGRPIKIEGNDLSSLSNGGATARVQASVLELYDTSRYNRPLSGGKEINWEEADSQIAVALTKAVTIESKIVILTGTVISPTTAEIIQGFLEKHPRSEWVQYDPLSFSAMLEANRLCFNSRVIPSLSFDKAQLVVSFGADFLGTWLMPGTFSHLYAKGRKVSEENPAMSRHIQFESELSLTGSNADERIQIKPSQVNEILAQLLDRLKGGSIGNSPFDAKIESLAAELKENAGKSLIVCGYNDLKSQLLVNSINNSLGNYGKTIDITTSVNLRRGSDTALQNLIAEMNAGAVSALFVHNVNPVFDYPDGEGFAAGMKKVLLKVSMAVTPDETATLCDYICPDNHYLESWGDAEPIAGQFSLQQPVIATLGNPRQMQESLLIWSGKEGDYQSYLKNYWETRYFPSAGTGLSFGNFWNECLQKGVWEGTRSKNTFAEFNMQAIDAVAPEKGPFSNGDGIFELTATQSIALGSGKHANNPWLQELPDPVSKISWDNFLSVSVADAESNMLATGDIVKINGSINIPVLVQPGQAVGTVSVFIGYGRKVAGKVGEGAGVNILPLTGMVNGCVSLNGVITSIEKTGEIFTLALSQSHHSMEGRDLVRETTLGAYRENPAAGNEMREGILKHMHTLYEEVTFEGLHWAMAIDLNACTGCSSCVIACQVENNIPVIGREEVSRRRIMHWMRIDRYYSGDEADPGVHFMPVMCQHCDNAPCENVCPVAATNHSNEGLNQMAYVRCIGTKYCINNCPYKVRRFNWFNYTRSDDFNTYMNNETGRLVLNPDVTVRERGIVEKCSFCVQRIQEAKIRAKTEKRILREDEIKPACAQTCPSGAIVFGNIADKDSAIAKLFRDKRNYHLLEELHTLPSVGYLTRIKNKQT